MSPRQIWQTSDGVIHVEKASADAHEASLAKYRFLDLPASVRVWAESFDNVDKCESYETYRETVRQVVDELLEAGFTIVEKEPVK